MLEVRRASRILAASLIAFAVLGLGGSAAASASWSAPRSLGGPVPPSLATPGPAAFVSDARGDVALAWRNFVKAGRPPRWWYDSSVVVAFGHRSGPVLARTVWRRSHSLVASVTAVLDSRGELTVAWIEAPFRSGGGTGGRLVVRAARRSPAGRWWPSEVVYAGGTAFFYASPRLAVAPGGEVLLTWNAGSAVGVQAAWHSAGRAFGPASAVSRSRNAQIITPTPAFDASGGAHVYGIAGCDASGSRGVMLTAPPGSRRFGAPVVIAPAPAANLAVSFGASGQAVASWQGTACSTLEPGPGGPFARVIAGGRLRAPVALDPGAYASTVTPVAARGGGGTVSWVESYSPSATAALWTVSAGAAGTFSPPSTPVSGLVPSARDGDGDLVLQSLPIYEMIGAGQTAPGVPLSPVAAQQAGGGAPEASPLRFSTSTPSAITRSTLAIAAAPVGGGISLAWQPERGGVLIATWRPQGRRSG